MKAMCPNCQGAGCTICCGEGSLELQKDTHDDKWYMKAVDSIDFTIDSREE